MYRTFKSSSYLFSVLILTASLSGLSSSGAQAAALYKWVDENGQIRYSDRLPATQAKKKHQQLNSQGVVLSTTEEAKSDEERALEAETKKKLAEQQAREAEIKKIQDEKDRVLLLTFSSEEELGLARDNRIDVLDSVIQLINKSIAGTAKKLEALQENADTNYLSKGLEVPGGLAQKIEHFTRKIENRTAQLRLKEDEKEKIMQKYDLDLTRFRLLKTETE